MKRRAELSLQFLCKGELRGGGLRRGGVLPVRLKRSAAPFLFEFGEEGRGKAEMDGCCVGHAKVF